MRAHSKEALSAYLDEQLSAVERRAVEIHLRDCAECAQELADLAAVDALVRENDEQPPAGYFDDLGHRWRERLRRTTPATFVPRRARSVVPSWAYPVAAALLVAAVAPFLIRHAQPPSARETSVREAVPAPPPAGAAVPRVATTPAPTQPAPTQPPHTSRQVAPRARSAETPRPEAPPMAPAPPPPVRQAEPSGPDTDQRFSQPPQDAAGVAPERRIETPADTAEPETALKAESATADTAAEAPRVLAAPRPMELRKRASGAGDPIAAQFGALDRRVPRGVEELRTTREAYRSLLTRHPRHRMAADGWVHLVELGVRAATLSSSPADWDQVRADGAAAAEHLSGDEARLERLRALLRSVPER